MNITENCLSYLKDNKWDDLNSIFSNKEYCSELSSDPMFSIFESNLVSEIQKFDNNSDENISLVLAHIFQLSQNKNSSLTLSVNCTKEIAQHLFKKYPLEIYAEILTNNYDAKTFLTKKSIEKKEKIENALLAGNLNIKIGQTGNFDFSKSIFNSPPEEDLYIVAKKVLINEILLPNTALSTIIDSKITNLLDSQKTEFYYKSTLDLCIVNPKTYKPVFFIELDSSWHDKPRQILKDAMKDDIFKIAGYKLHRLRKLQNKSMNEIFEIFIRQNYNR
ncbi:MAG: hypothetical protein COA67_08190 [Lutibacter sp.]|nr:MAG: hypothetical protein COA67_08190 [Lutibacter sp.]